MNSAALIWRDLTSHKPNPEVRRIHLLRTWVNKGKQGGLGSLDPSPPKHATHMLVAVYSLANLSTASRENSMPVAGSSPTTQASCPGGMT